MRARARLGGQKKLIQGKMSDWKSLQKMGMEEGEKDEAVAARAKSRLKE